ncbi:MAG TPA: C25 family cysteine peptidase [Bacteroidia bacterium]|nr:C25 family cysteine peptidase [Bacteroidia bacterium]
MKKITLIILTLFSSGMIIAGSPTNVQMISNNPTSITIQFKPGQYSSTAVSTEAGQATILNIEKGTPLLQKGAPDLPKLTSSFIIPDHGMMQATVTSSSFYDVENVNIAPSKGNLYRNINPQDIPYTKGEAYFKNEFFPSSIAALSTPYILRDFRAQTVAVCPFQYNPQTKTLRVYTSVTVTIELKSKSAGQNEFDRPVVGAENLDKEMNAIYSRQFINYQTAANNIRPNYTPVSESGSMLVICYDDFKADIAPFVKWKNQKGIATELVLKSVAGSTASAIKTYITKYYSSHPDLKYVLLVGDAPQVPSSKTSAGDSDNNYGYLTGNDSYPELFIGRFSATTSSQVQTMVNRTIAYEKTPQRDGVWYKKGIAIGSDQGPGDDNEYDWQHQRKIRTKLMGFTYNDVSENYDGSQGGVDKSGSPSASSIASQINAGVGIITYTGHGAENQFVTSGFSSSNATALTNDKMHPFVWAVACVNGNFVSGSCLAEAFTRAGTPAKPYGAVATLMSTINQSWNPPMEGQDAMVDILVESKSGNIKRTFGGISMNGCMQMNDTYSTGGDRGSEMTDTWTCFGDPSVMLFTDTPAPMAVTHANKIPLNTTTVTVNCDVKDALVCISKDGVILGTGVSDGKSVVITIPAATSGILDVTATAFNKIPYIGTINVSGTVGLDELADMDFMNVYPVPANNTINISGALTNAGKIKIALYNNLGQEILTISNESYAAGSFNKTVDVNQLPTGVYFCKLQTGVSTKIQRVIIER